MQRTRLLSCLTLLAFVGCAESNVEPEGLAKSRPLGGVQLRFDLDDRPFPDIPFPNDLATVVDPDSPTGRRVNVSLDGSSVAEDEVRRKINQMTGFGLVSPMWLSFDGPLDLHNLLERHAEPVPDFSDDAVYLVNVDPDSDAFGELVLLDIGRGNYPILHERPGAFFANDPRSQGTNLLYESYLEVDLDGDGELDPIEDTDDDGVWDVPNVLDLSRDPYAPGNTLTFYERETNSLIMRSVLPLDPDTTYAVVLTSALRGEDGLAVDSPFEWVNHTRQTEALEPLRRILPRVLPDRFDEKLADIRFAWTFTTQDPTRELQAIRAGLYGEGPLSWLQDQYPPELEMVHNGYEPGAPNPMTFDLQPVLDLVVPLLVQSFGVDSAAAGALEDSFENVDYVVSGSYVSPYFMADDDGDADTDPVQLAGPDGNPADDDESFEIDLATRSAKVGEDEVTFMCTVPTTIPGVREPPFNTVIYSHAISSTRLEVVLLFGGSMAKFGIAMCAIDAVGHGVAVPAEFQGLIGGLAERLNVPGFAGIVEHHRARDLNNDGIPESGGKYFTADILHSRDNMRQTAIDQMQLIRILRSWDGEKRFPPEIDEDSPYVKARGGLVSPWDQDGDGESEIAGDFNADGIVDFGGDVVFGAFGTSLGGIQSAILAGIEPTVRNVASNAGGGILGEIAIRTTIGNVRNGVHLRMFGPLFVGSPINEGGEWRGKVGVSMILASADSSVTVPFTILDGIENGDRIVLRNPNREARAAVPEEDKRSVVHVRNGRFRVGISADSLSANSKRARLGFLHPRLDMVKHLMNCPTRSRCGDEDCGGGSTCSLDGQSCRPITACIWEFDGTVPADRVYKSDFYPDGLDAVALEAEIQRRTLSADNEFSPVDFGDPLKLEVYSSDGQLKQVVDTFPQNFVFENIFYPAGAPLAAPAQGWGIPRQTPTFRKFLAVSQMLLEGADPAVWATRYFRDPIQFPYEDPRFQSGETNLLMIGTIGDQTVPISSSIAIARAAGILDVTSYDPRWNMTENQYLVNNFVYEGVSWFDRYPAYPGTLFDADDLDDGAWGPADSDGGGEYNVDARFPVRATIPTNGDGVSALRLAYLKSDGEHTFNAPNPNAPFDAASFMTNQVGWYLLQSGREVKQDRCMEVLDLSECDFFDPATDTPPALK